MNTGDLAKAILKVLPSRQSSVSHETLSPEGQALRAKLRLAVAEYRKSEQYKKDAQGKVPLQRPLWMAEQHKAEDEELRARVNKLKEQKELPF